MFSSIIDYLKTLMRSRIFTLIVVYVVLFSILVGRLFYLQIVQGEAYDEQATIKNEKQKTIKSSRGKIYDCNGKLLASNEQSYAITLEDTGEIESNKQMNEMILKCINLIEKNGDKVTVDFPITIDKKGRFKFTVDKNAQLRFKREIYFCKSVDELTDEQKNMTAEECFRYIRTSTAVNAIHFFDPLTEKNKNEADAQEKYEQNYDDATALKIMAIRYALMMNTYQKYEPITISSDVSLNTVAAIKENSASLIGIDVSEEAKRVYYDSTYFSHIIGYTGLISSDTLASMKENGDNTYTAADQIGKSGIESTFEEQLRGKKGSETLVIDSSSRVVETKDHKDATAGKDIYLTIDADLQSAVYQLTEKAIAGVLISKLNNSKSAGSKGKDAKNIRVPIYDVYCAIIENSLVDITKFSNPDASNLEKSVYQTFTREKKNSLKAVKRYLSYNNKTTTKKMSDTNAEYMDYIYSMLRKNEVIATDKMDKSDDMYNQYANEKISLSEFLIYAISHNWIDLEMLNVGDDYYSTEEIYSKIVEYILEELNDDSSYDKKVYHTLIYNDQISGRQVCMLLYEQGVLDMNSENSRYSALAAGSLGAYDFMTYAISNKIITPAQLALEPCSASAVVTNPKNGDIIAMVSYPSYDNNKLSGSVDAKYFNSLINDKASPMLNRATQSFTAPGSTYKPCTTIAGMDTGIISSGTTFYCSGSFDKVTPSPKCWRLSGHGGEVAATAIRDSCNVFFYNVGYNLACSKNGNYNSTYGTTILQKYSDLLGLSTKAGVEIEESEPMASNTNSVASAIGQGNHKYSTLNLARYVTTIATSGTCYNLTLVDKITDSDGNLIEDNHADVDHQVELSSNIWSTVHEGMMLAGNSYSTIAKLGLKIAAKSGTAQENTNEPDHSLLVTYSPYDDPQICVSVCIQHGYSSTTSMDLTADVYKIYYGME